jgi:abhydrolase domain-containing protein 13
MGYRNITQESHKLIGKIDAPILFLSGLRDELVPKTHMVELHNLAKARQHCKTFMETFKHGTHNDTCIQPGYFEAMRKFLMSII